MLHFNGDLQVPRAQKLSPAQSLPLYPDYFYDTAFQLAKPQRIGGQAFPPLSSPSTQYPHPAALIKQYLHSPAQQDQPEQAAFKDAIPMAVEFPPNPSENLGPTIIGAENAPQLTTPLPATEIRDFSVPTQVEVPPPTVLSAFLQFDPGEWFLAHSKNHQKITGEELDDLARSLSTSLKVPLYLDIPPTPPTKHLHEPWTTTKWIQNYLHYSSRSSFYFNHEKVQTFYQQQDSSELSEGTVKFLLCTKMLWDSRLNLILPGTEDTDSPLTILDTFTAEGRAKIPTTLTSLTQVYHQIFHLVYTEYQRQLYQFLNNYEIGGTTASMKVRTELGVKKNLPLGNLLQLAPTLKHSPPEGEIWYNGYKFNKVEVEDYNEEVLRRTAQLEEYNGEPTKPTYRNIRVLPPPIKVTSSGAFDSNHLLITFPKAELLIQSEEDLSDGD